MGESLYLAFFIWAVVYFAESDARRRKALTKCGLCLAAACLTRYDGWFLAVAMAGVVLLQTIFSTHAAEQSTTDAAVAASPNANSSSSPPPAPALWLAYNGAGLPQSARI